jgi:prolyl oligopeptidase
MIGSMLLSCNKSGINYPETRKDNTVDTYFGSNVEDPYRWLEDDRSEETMQWVKAQNEVTFSYLEKIPFREKIKNRLTSLMNYERMSTPSKEGENYFYSANNGLQNQDVIYVKKSLQDEGSVFLDPNTMSEGGTVALTAFSISNDYKYAGYGISRGGSDWNEYFVKEIETGKTLDDHLKWIKFSSMAWYKDGFFYSRFDEPKQGDELKGMNTDNKIYYHKLGTAQSEDKLVYSDPSNPLRSFGASVTEDERYLVMLSYESTTGNAVHVKDLTKNNADFVKVVDNFDNDYNFVEGEGDKLLFLTNHNAPMYKLIEIDMKKPEMENWLDIIGEKKAQVLSSCSLAGGKIIARYQKDARSLLEVYNRNGEYLHEISLPSLGTVTSFRSKNKENTAFFGFTSFNTPPEVYRYDAETNTSELFFKPNVDFKSDDYITKQVFYKSKDGTLIPMFIVHHKDVVPDSKRPVLLYGYGGFNITNTPSFSIRTAVWLENKGVYALAGIRGGGEYGEDWHLAGTIFNKQNVFDDFIGAAEYLIQEKYTSPAKLAILGGSNGGLLVGAVVNQRPDLFAVAFPAVGVMDMLRFHKFTIGRFWVTDYGSSEDSLQFENLYKYSPLHNIREGVEYPAIMVTTADHDDRVVPAHSFKYIAEMQAKHTGNNPTLIRIETEAGHGAGKPVSKAIEELTDMISFAFYQMKINPI